MQISKLPEKTIFIAVLITLVIGALFFGMHCKMKFSRFNPGWNCIYSQWKGVPYWSPDRRHCIVHTSLNDQTLILKGDDFSEVSVVNGFIYPTWSHDSKKFAARGRGVEIYELSGRMVNRFEAAPPISFSWSPKNYQIAIADGYNVSIGNLQQGTQVYLESHPADFSWDEPAWSPDGQRIAAFGFNTSIRSNTKYEPASVLRVWDIASKKLLFSIENLPARCRTSWSPDGNYFLYSIPGELHVLNSSTFKPVTTIQTSDANSIQVYWSSDGKQLVIKDDDKLRFFHSDKIGIESRTVNAKANGYFDFSWSPNGKYILINGHTAIAIVHSETGKYLGYRECNSWNAEWASNNSIVLSDFHSGPEFVSLRLPQINEAVSPFNTGLPGAPPWFNYPRPGNLEECFAAYDKSLNLFQKEWFKRVSEDHLYAYGGGSIITDSLLADVDGCWGKAELTKFFYKHGIYDSRNMDGILVDSYWRYLNKKPINFDQQVKKYSTYNLPNRMNTNIYSDLHKKIVDCQISSVTGDTWSLGSRKAKFKFISFIDADSKSSLELLRGLEELRKEYSSRNLEILVLIVPSDSKSRKNLQPTDEKIRDIQKILGEEALIACIPEKLYRALNNHEKYMSKFVLYATPQTLILKGKNKATVMISGFDEKWTKKLIRRNLKFEGLKTKYDGK